MDDYLEGLDPAAALAAIDDTRAATLERMSAISWPYDLIYAALAASLVGVQALPFPVNVAGDAAVVVGLAALVRWHRARTGVWVSGLGPWRARWVSLAIGLIAGVAAIAVSVESRRGEAWVGLPAALAVGLGALVGSRLWRLIFKGELASGAMPIASGNGGFGIGVGMRLVAGLGVSVCVMGCMLVATHADTYTAAMIIGVGVGLIVVPPVKAGLLRLRAR
jgi:hypothetical protein